MQTQLPNVTIKNLFYIHAETANGQVENPGVRLNIQFFIFPNPTGTATSSPAEKNTVSDYKALGLNEKEVEASNHKGYRRLNTRNSS